MTSDHDKTDFAYRLNSPAEVPEPDPRADTLKGYEEARQDQQQRVEMARLEADWKQYDDRIKGPKIRTLAEQKKDQAENEYFAGMGIHEWARKKRAEAAEIHKNDPQGLNDANELILKIERKYS